MYREFKLKTFLDQRGGLTPVEVSNYCDFDVKRVYTVYSNKEKRGGHAHLVEEEVFFMAAGTCVARLHDKANWIEISLSANENLIYVGKLIWHEFDNFSDDAVLVALSSTNYNPDRSDYIEDFDKFLNYV